MADYLSKVTGKTFMDLVEDDDFKADLVKFFSGTRYNMSVDEMRERGFEGLANDFVRHMRYQSTNEATAAKDVFFAKDKNATDESKMAFGKLMEAYDASDGGGTGIGEGIWDYVSAFGTSPSTLITAATMGFGVGSKLAGRGASAAAQLAVRSELSKLIAKGASKDAAVAAVKKKIADGALDGAASGVAKRQAMRVLPGSVTKEAAKSAGISATVEGALGAGMGYASREARAETIEDYGYSTGDVLQDAVISATIGGGLGGALGGLDARTRNNVFNSFFEMAKRQEAAAKVTRANASKTIKKAPKEKQDEYVARAAETLEQLDPNLVLKGDQIKQLILTGETYNPSLSERGFSLDTIRGVAAASIELDKKIKRQPGERISAAVGRAIDSGLLKTDDLASIKENYGLTSEHLSYVWLSDLSEAGKTLQQASAIKSALEDIKNLSKKGVATPDERMLDNMAEDIKKGKPLLYWGAQQLDQASIAMMTSQLGTSAANVAGTFFNIAADVSDQIAAGIYRATISADTSKKAGNAFKGSLDVIRGLNFTNSNVRALEALVARDAPLEYKRTFFDVIRADEVIGGDSSKLLRFARGMNHINSTVDGVYKRGIFYGALNRQLRDYGTDVNTFLKTAKTLDDLPEGVFDKAVNEARRLTMQKSYYGDKSTFGQAASTVEKFHRNVPFLMSQGVGLPFPRYVANHLEYIADYTPIGIGGGILDKADGILGFKMGDKFKTTEERVARQITGLGAIVLGIQLHTSGNSPDYETLKMKAITGQGEEGGGVDLKRSLGPWIGHMYLGEVIARHIKGEPLEKSVAEIAADVGDISAGMTDLGFQGGLIGDLLNLADNPSPTKIDAVSKSLGNFVSTFTYPTTISRDLWGQAFPDASPTPYTRNLLRGGSEEVYDTGNLFTYIVRNEQFLNQATRFMPDLDYFNYAANRSGSSGYDIPQFSMGNPRPVGAYNPITKQFGFKEKPPQTAIEDEWQRLQLEEYQLKTPISNPAVDLLVNHYLGTGFIGKEKGLSLNKKFLLWKDNPDLGIQEYEGRTYGQLDDSEKRRVMKDFVRYERAEAKEMVESFLNAYINSENPAEQKAAAGYVRNMYFLADTRGNKDALSTATGIESRGAFKDPEKFFLNSETVAEELSKRMAVLNRLKTVGGDISRPTKLGR